jgi:hypothetical protein
MVAPTIMVTAMIDVSRFMTSPMAKSMETEVPRRQIKLDVTFYKKLMLQPRIGDRAFACGRMNCLCFTGRGPDAGETQRGVARRNVSQATTDFP